MATLMAGHRKMEESKQVRDDLSTKQALKLHQGVREPLSEGRRERASE